VAELPADKGCCKEKESVRRKGEMFLEKAPFGDRGKESRLLEESSVRKKFRLKRRGVRKFVSNVDCHRQGQLQEGGGRAGLREGKISGKR